MKAYLLTDIVSALRAGNRNDLCPMASAQRRAAAYGNPMFARAFQQLRERCETAMGHYSSSLPFSQYAAINRTGDRSGYERIYFEDYILRVNAAGVMYLFDGGEKYKTLLEDTLWAFCDLYTWALPAHLHGNGERTDDDPVSAADAPFFPKAHRHEPPFEIDLDTASNAYSFALLLYLLKDKLSPVVQKRVSREISRRVLEPYVSLNSYFFWETLQTNWTAVCSGYTACAAIYMLEDDEMLAPILVKALQGMENYLRGFGRDGVCDEGIGYWGYGFGAFCQFAELLCRRTNGKIDLFDDEKVKSIAQSPSRCYLIGKDVATFADAGQDAKLNIELAHFLKHRYPDLDMPPKACMSNPGTARHVYSQLFTYTWCDASLETEAGFPMRCEISPDAQMMISRRKMNGHNAALAFKGGNNGVSHNHNDVGNVIFDVDGEQLISDLGSGKYTWEYFNGDRYSFFAASSRSHNVPIVDGQYQQAGAERAASGVSMRAGGEMDTGEMELRDAYAVEALTSLRRSVAVNGREATLRDSARFLEDGRAHTLTERFVTRVRPAITKNGSVRIGEKLLLESEICPKISEQPFNDGDLAYLIDYETTDIRGCAEFCVKMVPIGE